MTNYVQTSVDGPKKHFFKFSSNSEASASELLENLENVLHEQ